MIRLLLKIFFVYWAVAGIVIAISDFAPHRHVHHPELTDALDSALVMDGRIIVDAYEAGRCQEFQKATSNSRDALYLVSTDGRLLCGDSGLPNAAKLIAAAEQRRKRLTDDYALFQLLATPITSPTGAHYVVLLKSSYTSALQLYGLLPGNTTVAISLVVTIFLGLLIAMPIRRLRLAAGQIAMGKLDARVRWGKPSAPGSALGRGDDLDQLIRDFNYMAERLQALVKGQRTLLRDISHELRSPLTRLGVGLGLARVQSSPEMHEALDRIGSEATRLNILIGQILSLSHADVMERMESLGQFPLSELLLDLLPDIEYEAAQCQCPVITNIAPSGNVSGDEELLRAAIENVLRNAIRYAAADGPIEIETGIEERKGKRFSRVRVSDHGPGIPEHELSFVREPFYRADRSRHHEQEGTGIGLAIADRAVRLHGGLLEIRNRPQGGLVVEICLPVVEKISAVRDLANDGLVSS